MQKPSHLNRPCHEGLLVLDFGSQYTLLIVRRLREIGVYAEVIDAESVAPPNDFKFNGIILSGGPDSVDTGRSLPKWVLASDKPVLGICYGMQLLVQEFGGVIKGEVRREYGASRLLIENSISTGKMGVLFTDLVQSDLTVWMSHGDHADTLPADFITLGYSADHIVAAVAHRDKPLWGLQFHPEVQHSPCGRQILENFSLKICGALKNWQTGSMIQSLTQAIRDQVQDGRVLVAVSGGVDSTVAAVLLHQALSAEQVHAVMVNTGLLRKNEQQWVSEWLNKIGLKHFIVLEKQKEFLKALNGVADPEQKRKIIGRKFIEEFEHFSHGKSLQFLAQGTLYPDVIESAGHGAGSKVIKSHHNVGGLPEKLKLALVEPFRFLFKDEVRLIGRELGLPAELVDRHPFPGPGLGIRVLGAIDEEKLNLLREADAIFLEELRRTNLYHSTWQAFCVLLPVKSVGVMGDNRTYQYTLALRAVDASDGMTAKATQLPMDFLAKVTDRIIRQVVGINRVVYDLTSKPPATIEWE